MSSSGGLFDALLNYAIDSVHLRKPPTPNESLNHMLVL